MPEETGEGDEPLRLAAARDGVSWGAPGDRSRDRLRRVVAFRLDEGRREKAAAVRHLRAVRRPRAFLRGLGGDWVEP
jgi:hypothetical protein